MKYDTIRVRTSVALPDDNAETTNLNIRKGLTIERADGRGDFIVTGKSGKLIGVPPENVTFWAPLAEPPADKTADAKGKKT